MPGFLSSPASFRDPGGFVYYQDKLLYRQVNSVCREDYDNLMGSGLYDHLVREGILVPHEEVSLEKAATDEAYKIIKPQLIPFISYPYEWSFSQLKNAALLTLRAQKEALKFGMTLKDSSAYNVQFCGGKPILIDTLSFEHYQEGEPWVAYRQFCQHFLSPLALSSRVDVRLVQLLRNFIDGIPLDLTSSLLPRATYLNFSLLSHIHLHARSQKHFADKPVRHRRPLTRFALHALLDNLESLVSHLNWAPKKSEWTDYYESSDYTAESFRHKAQLVSEILDAIFPDCQILWDLGANTGAFSRISSSKGIFTVAFDSDPTCVESNYVDCVRMGETRILPLLLDLTNPSPDLGWENKERASWLGRGPADVVLALALLHHLAISNNLPFRRIAELFSRVTRELIIEFVPKSDRQVQRLLVSRQDIFPEYDQLNFEREFESRFKIRRVERIEGSERLLYWMGNPSN